jgi:hypothetical protein
VPEGTARQIVEAQTAGKAAKSPRRLTLERAALLATVIGLPVAIVGIVITVLVTLLF